MTHEQRPPGRCSFIRGSLKRSIHKETTMRIARSILIAGVLVALAACQREDDTATAPATPAAGTPAATAPADGTAPTGAAGSQTPADAGSTGGADAANAATAQAEPPATGTPPADSAMIGVAECDDYLAKYEACLTGNVPEASRAAMQQSLDATRAGWRQALATPGGRDSLAAACTQMRETSRQTMQAYGCTDF
jgi:hypothetical protein